MAEPVALAVVGAGPAGMACAIAARRRGLTVTVIDEQPGPGGQIWRGIEQAGRFGKPEALYSEHEAGVRTVAEFRACGATYLPDTQLFQLEPGWRLFLRDPGGVRILRARDLIIATGAMERPVVFDDWTLPGVMTVGAAQILFKRSGLVPTGPVWLAGYGPLLLLYAAQLLSAGGRIAGVIDTRPASATGGWLRPFIGAALRAAPDLAKGAAWMAQLRLARVPVIRATGFAAEGQDRLEAITVTDRAGRLQSFAAQHLLVHEGLVPRPHDGMLAGVGYVWDAAQGCLVAQDGAAKGLSVQVIGDAARIAGARAALAAGTLAGAGAGGPQPGSAGVRDAALRAFLDAYFPPRTLPEDLPDTTPVCRCEDITAAAIRAEAAAQGIDQIKGMTRAGMGRCQGRQCAIAVARLHGLASGRPEAAHQTYRSRPPLKPLRMGDLATLAPGPPAPAPKANRR